MNAQRITRTALRRLLLVGGTGVLLVVLAWTLDAAGYDWGYDEDGESRLVERITTLVDEVGGRVDWSHQHNLIAFSKRGTDGYYDVYTMHSDGHNQKCLTCDATGIAQLNNGQPAWHPSGRYIVFQSQDPDLRVPPQLARAGAYLTQGGVGINNNLWIVTKNGKRFYQLTNIRSREATLHPHFSHDGSKLLWTERSLEDRTFGAQWVLKVADFVVGEQDVPRVTNVRNYRPRGEDNTFYESHGFSPDDRAIIFTASIGTGEPFDQDIWTMDLETQRLMRLTRSRNEWNEHAQYSPGGQKIAWITSRGYYYQPGPQWSRMLKTDYWLMNADGSEPERLTYFNEPGYPEYTGERIIAADSSWNEDGDKLVASLGVIGQGTKESRIVLIELAQSVNDGDSPAQGNDHIGKIGTGTNFGR